jgi:hypothetical protein
MHQTTFYATQNENKLEIHETELSHCALLSPVCGAKLLQYLNQYLFFYSFPLCPEMYNSSCQNIGHF